MAKSPEQLLDKQLENETTIRWDETGGNATLWTYSSGVAKQWRSFGFAVVAMGRGWLCNVPPDRITYKPMKKA